MKAMRKQYGDKEGESVFYASKNKGTISGVEKTEESKMSYLEKVLSISEEEKRGVKPGSMLADMGFTGAKKTDLSKLPKGKKTLKNPDQNIAPMGKKNESHTEYKRIGALMAEALGYRVDEIAPVVGLAARTIGKKVIGGMAKKAAKKGAEMAADKMKPEQQEESYIYPYYMLALHIAEAADEGFVKSPLAKRAAATSGAKRVSDVDKPGTAMTPDVKRIAREGNKIVSKKVGAKTNVKTDAALQIGQRARRKANRAAGRGGFGNAPLPKGASAAMQQRELQTPEDRRR